MYCIKCGAKNPDQAQFCGQCGQPIGEVSNVAAPPRPFVKHYSKAILSSVVIVGVLIMIAGGVWAYQQFFNPGKIAFISNRHNSGNTSNSSFAIYVMDANGENVKQLTLDSPRSAPIWSPNGKQIAYVSDTDRSLQVINPDSPSASIVIANSVSTDWLSGFDWSPDGQKLVYVNSNGQLSVVNVDGTGRVNLNKSGSDPKWSPDGSRIAYTSNNDIYTVLPEGTSATKLNVKVYNSSNLSNLSWSPDSKQIVYLSFESQGRDLYTMNTSTSQQIRLSILPTETKAMPQWSPNGKMIAFITYGNKQNGIYVMQAVGTQLTKISDYRDVATVSWSRDSRYIFFFSTRDDPKFDSCSSDCNYEIYRYAVDSGEVKRLTNTVGIDAFPVWSPR